MIGARAADRSGIHHHRVLVVVLLLLLLLLLWLLYELKRLLWKMVLRLWNFMLI